MAQRVDAEEFRELGIVKLERLIPDQLVAAARARVYAVLAQQGAWSNGAWAGGTDWYKQPLKQCSRSAVFADLLQRRVLEVATALAGENVLPGNPKTQLLLTPPSPKAWEVPATMWHLDYPRFCDGLPGVQMFTFLDTVRPRGGGTLLVAGSHRLLNDRGALGSKEVKRILSKEPYFARLMDKRCDNRAGLIDEVGHIGGVPLKVVELTGAPGDVYFTDLRLLHSLGPNATPRPRLMVTQRFLRARAVDQMQDAHRALVEKRSARREARKLANTRPDSSLKQGDANVRH